MIDTDEITRLRAENERLREELDTWKSVFPDIAPQSVMPDRSLVEQENERLRAALEQLLACPAIADGNHNDPAWACHETAAAETFARKVLARAALAAQPAPGEVEPRTDSRYNNAERIFGDD